ncbi:Cytochrome P450 E-class CYP52 [Penicillium frequentans]|uniref:Cytochrome P450 E-class CYP52 n=1 Tax=Penicillium frequentans TaxID=3151616 RepID=A0AAD6CH62_9EURO|nr:Cytochrome P450 E-class CYP52 [Penicillium glabrum]
MAPAPPGRKDISGFLGYIVYHILQAWRRYTRDKSFGDAHGCLPMKTWIPYRWPLGLDILKRQYDALPEQRLLLFQSQYFEKLGPNMTFNIFGKQGYITADPENIKSILSTHFEDWCLGSRRRGLMPMLGKGIFTQDDREWMNSRRLLGIQFKNIHVQDCKVFDEHVTELIRKIHGKIRPRGGLVDLQPFFFRLTLATTTALIFGEEVSHSTAMLDEFEKAFDYASYVSAIRLRLADLEWIWKPAKFTAACAVVKGYADHFVQTALHDRHRHGEKQALEKHGFILTLFEELQDPVLVRDQLVHLMIAGRDTTACLLSWVFFLLVRHPEALEELRKEIRDKTDNFGELSRAGISKMQYLRCVINETHRLYPQLPVNVRVASRTTFIPKGGGSDGKSPVLIPEGTGVGYSVYHMHRSKSLYGEDANSFRPERWLGPELKSIGWGFMPFSRGPRACLGMDFALTEASYAIVRIIKEFPTLRLPPEMPIVPPGEERQILTIVVRSAEGCKVLLN